MLAYIYRLVFLLQATNYNRISEAELKDFEEAFNLYDENNDGHITTTELSTVLKKLGQNPSEQQIADFIKECDTDKNGTIDFLEFCRYLVNFRRKVVILYEPFVLCIALHSCDFELCLLICSCLRV